MKVSLVGTGCGPSCITEYAGKTVSRAELLIGARRQLDLFPESSAEKIQEYRAAKIVGILRRSKAQRACVLYSGDTGFYSGAAGLIPLLDKGRFDVEIIPGISSVQYFSSLIGEPYQNWNLCSVHGRNTDVIAELMKGKDTLFITSGSTGPSDICKAVTKAGLGGIEVLIGEDLGYESERVYSGCAGDLKEREFSPLNVILVKAPPLYDRRLPGICDNEFIRAGVPMTKQEIRACIISKIGELTERSGVFWDIGAGTGSVSVEMSGYFRRVYAIEEKPEAAELIKQNREKFCAWNIKVAEGHAPDALEGLEAPDAVFIGGSGGETAEIIERISCISEDAPICVSAVTLESLNEAVSALRKLSYDTGITQIAVSRSSPAGDKTIMKALNPVYIVAGSRK